MFCEIHHALCSGGVNTGDSDLGRQIKLKSAIITGKLDASVNARGVRKVITFRNCFEGGIETGAQCETQ